MDRNEHQKKWRAEHPEKMALYNERTKIRQRGKRKQYIVAFRKYRKANKAKVKTWNKTYLAKLRKERPWAFWHKNVRSRCNNKCLWYRKKGIKYQLSLEQIKHLWFRDKAFLLKKPSIDRKNGKGNYTLENSRFIEHSENMRRKRSTP